MTDAPDPFVHYMITGEVKPAPQDYKELITFPGEAGVRVPISFLMMTGNDDPPPVNTKTFVITVDPKRGTTHIYNKFSDELNDRGLGHRHTVTVLHDRFSVPGKLNLYCTVQGSCKECNGDGGHWFEDDKAWKRGEATSQWIECDTCQNV